MDNDRMSEALRELVVSDQFAKFLVAFQPIMNFLTEEQLAEFCAMFVEEIRQDVNWFVEQRELLAEHANLVLRHLGCEEDVRIIEVDPAVRADPDGAFIDAIGVYGDSGLPMAELNKLMSAYHYFFDATHGDAGS